MSFLVGLNSSGNQINNNVIASNVSVETFDTFPTTSTGDATGNYNHLGIDGQNNNKWDFLNVSGTLDGGFNLWNSSSSQAPQLLTSIDNTGLTIDRSSGGVPPLLSPPILSIPDGSHINFSVDLTQPPYNMVYQNLTANPVYMTQTNSFYTTGELVYAFVTAPTQVQLFKNDPITNPIPPNTVPSGFPTTDTNGLTVGIPVFAFSLPTPGITKTSLLTGDTLLIKNSPDYDSTSLSDTGLTLTNSDATNIHLTASSFNINGNAKTVVLNETNMIITDASNNNSIVSSTNLTLNSNYFSGNPLNVINMSSNNIQLLDNDQGFIGSFNPTYLTLNDGGANAQLTTTDLTFNGHSYAQNQVSPTLIYSSPAIYADGHEPATSLSVRNTYGYSGWYFKNVSPNTPPTNKINWYFPPCNKNITSVSDLKGISVSFFNGNTTSNDNTLFITVLTVPTGSNDYAPGFYHSSMTYIFDQTITPVINTNYQGVCIIDKQYIPFNFESQIQYQQSPVNNPKGTYSQTDKILAVVIQTNSASPTGSVELVVNKLNLIYTKFTQSYLLIPP
jgi:hypothetical protein